MSRSIGRFGAVQLFGGGRIQSGTAAPLSGTSGSPLGLPKGSLYMETTYGVLYRNENTAASPYWTPVNFRDPGLRGWHEDFRDGVGKAIADTAASAILASGVRVHGQGIAETDSGLTIAYTAEVGPIASLIATDEASHLAALGVGNTTLPFQPDVHGPLVIDVEFAHLSAITLRETFCGFIGATADALDPVVTASGTTLTLVLDDLAGMFQSVGLTDADGVFAPHNKSDEAASIATSATGVDPSVTIAAAGTYQRWRVEISRAGVMTCFVNKAQVTRIAASLDADEEVAPSFYIASTSTATKTALLKRFATWGFRA